MADLDLDLPPIALAFLAAHGASRTAPTADDATLTALLAELGYPSHPSVLALEASYGGLRLFEADPDVPALVVGAYAALSALRFKAHGELRVPVMFASNGVVYSLDAEGRGWAVARMVEGRPRLTARNGKQLLTQALLWRALELLPRSYDAREGHHGEAAAKELGLPRIDEACCSRHERWWGTLDRLIVEIPRGNGYEGPITYVGR